MTTYSLDVLLSQFGTSLLLHVWFLRRQVRWSGILISLRIFRSLLWSTQSRLWHNQQSRCFFLEFSCFFYDPADVGNLISGSSAFSKSSLNIWKFLVHVLLKPSLVDLLSTLTRPLQWSLDPHIWDLCRHPCKGTAAWELAEPAELNEGHFPWWLWNVASLAVRPTQLLAPLISG